MQFLFVTDLHEKKKKYDNLFTYVTETKPDAVLIGGDLLPIKTEENDISSFIKKYIISPIKKIKNDVKFFIILGNDDPRIYEELFIEADKKKILHYMHEKTLAFSDVFITGYAYIPPTPFQLKDWERYDVSRFVDVGAISPEEGYFSFPLDMNKIKYGSIKKDLDDLVKNAPPNKTIFLFHSPPYDSFLDRAGLDGKMIDHTPLDVHIGSIAIKRFIEKYQPFITLHGHVHESSHLTGYWKQKFKETYSFSAAFTDEKLAVIKVDTNNPEDATRILL